MTPMPPFCSGTLEQAIKLYRSTKSSILLLDGESSRELGGRRTQCWLSLPRDRQSRHDAPSKINSLETMMKDSHSKNAPMQTVKPKHCQTGHQNHRNKQHALLLIFCAFKYSFRRFWWNHFIFLIWKLLRINHIFPCRIIFFISACS